MASHSQALQSHYPWTSTPLIASAPMRLISTAPLALEVSRAGGVGFLGIGTNSLSLEPLLQATIYNLVASPIPNTPSGILPVGVGFICWGADLQISLGVLRSQTLKPAAAWLFAPSDIKELVAWTMGIREVTGGKTRIWVQVGTVEDAIEVARRCRPDVLVLQGADAGGHGLRRSASIISLLPECVDALEKEWFRGIPVIAAGGIADGRGVAAALMLGASGVSMGTRFLASMEANISHGYREEVIRATDGGVSTARTDLYDRLRGTTGWPEYYDGRAVVNVSFFDYERGMADGENKILYGEAVRMGDEGWGEKGRMTTYAGTGVGLVRRVMPAGLIVWELLNGVREAFASAGSRL